MEEKRRIPPSLMRALSWPLLPASGTPKGHTGGCSDQEKHSNGININNNHAGGISTSPTFQQLITTRRLLYRHYYPEGGWGIIIIIVGVLVQTLTHGLQLAFGVFLMPTSEKFHQTWINAAYGARLVTDLRQLMTLRQHYYPEGGWGWLLTSIGLTMQCISHGLHTSAGVLMVEMMRTFNQDILNAGWLGALSTAVALGISPITVALCKRKSTRLTAVIGGLVTALGCLFTSFASQFHQLFFSYATVVGIGVGMTRDCSTLMVAQYFKRRREFVEIFIVAGSGLGITVMSAFIKSTIDSIGWRLGLQAVTGVVFLTFILGTFYRSASLYHPQRRAILHLKNQRRKIKDKNKQDDSPPFFDFRTLRSKTVRILLVSTAISGFGINTPIYYLAHQMQQDGIGDRIVILQAYLGLAFMLGCGAFGMLVVRNSVECRIARQYLCQTSIFMCGISILAFTAVQGNYHGYVMFVWIYGIFCGGYHYSLKMYTYERVRARNFARTWGFVQFSQAAPIAFGIPLTGYISERAGAKEGYYFSSVCALLGCLVLFFVDLHRRNLSRHKHTRANGTRHLCTSDSCPQRRKLSFSQEPDHEPGVLVTGATLMIGSELLIPQLTDKFIEPAAEKPELTCISEEGIADMDLPDNLLDDLDYVGDCITSCNKVENFLMLSEFENNLNAEIPAMLERRRRRVSISMGRNAKICEAHEEITPAGSEKKPPGRHLSTNCPEHQATIANSHRHHKICHPPSNAISVIDEASV